MSENETEMNTISTEITEAADTSNCSEGSEDNDPGDSVTTPTLVEEVEDDCEEEASIIPTDRPEVMLGDLSGPDGNAFMVLGKARKAGKTAGWTDEQLSAFMQEAESGSYKKLLMTVNKHFTVMD